MHVRPWSTVRSALSASDAGVPDAINARRHRVAVKTIRRWRRDYQRRGLPRGQQHLGAACPRCEKGDLDAAAYAELLGWYLGDGHVTKGRREVYSLHVYNDVRYVRLNAEIARLMTAVKPGGRPHTRTAPGCVVTTVSWKHWPCLFPQHGPGRKHERPIVLEDWQRRIVERHPVAFVRGLLHSDGCRFVNRVTRDVMRIDASSEGSPLPRSYTYPRWQFVNASQDILGLCGWALDLAGVEWRRTSSRRISVSRRAAVERLDRLVGPKG